MAHPPLLTRPFALLTVGHFLQALGYATMVLFPLYLDHLQATRTEIGLVMASAAMGGLVLRPLVGWALDAIGRRPTLIAGTVVLSAAMALIGLVDRIGLMVYLVRILYGIGVGTTFTAYFTFATDLVPAERRTEGIALFGVSGLLPLVFNPFIRGAGIAAADLRWFFPIVGAFILSSLLALFALREPPRSHAAEPLRLRVVFDALRRRTLWPVWLATAVFATLVAVFMAFATVTAVHRGVELSAGIWFTYGLGAIAVRLFGARLPDRVGVERMVAPALATYILAAVVAVYATSSAAFLLAGALAGVAHGYCFPVLTTQVVDRIPERLRGSGIATFTALWDASALLLTPVFGVIADASSDAALFATAATGAAVGLLGWWLLERAFGKNASGTALPANI